jgi:hypothetical protein
MTGRMPRQRIAELARYGVPGDQPAEGGERS